MLGRSVGSPKRRRPTWWIGQGGLVMFTAFALAVVVAAGAPKGPAHAADPAATTTTSPATTSPAEDAVSWNPGVVTFLVENSGCHTAQIASMDTATPAIADTVSADLVADSSKITDFSSKDPDMKVVEINGVQKNGTHIAFMIDAWLSNSACAQATRASAQSAPAQQVSFTTGPGAGAAATTPRVLGTVNLADRHQVALMGAFAWFKQAVKVMIAAVAFFVITKLAFNAILWFVMEGGGVLALAAMSALAGCIGSAAALLIVGRILFPDATSTTKDRIAVAVRGCIAGAVAGTSTALLGRAVAALVRRRLNTTPAILGDSGMAAANQAGVDVTGLSSMVDGVADGALAAQ